MDCIPAVYLFNLPERGIYLVRNLIALYIILCYTLGSFFADKCGIAAVIMPVKLNQVRVFGQCLFQKYCCRVAFVQPLSFIDAVGIIKRDMGHKKHCLLPVGIVFINLFQFPANPLYGLQRITVITILLVAFASPVRVGVCKIPRI